MTDTQILWLGAAVLVVAAVAVLYLILSGGRVVALSRRRPPDTAPLSGLTRSADAATRLAGRALGTRAGALEEALDQAGIRSTPQEFLVLVASGMVALFAVGGLLWGPLQGLVLLFLGPLLAYILVRIQTERRRKKFGLQLDETLAILSGSLRAGYSLPQACTTVAAETEAPTSEEFARVSNEARVGRPFVAALEDAAVRVKNDDFYWIVQAIAINREVGGNLADVLEGVGRTIRERTHLKRQVDALAAEGKLSAIILGALPFVMFLLLSLVNPSYIARLYESLTGILILVAGGIMLLIGILWLRVLVRIKY